MLLSVLEQAPACIGDPPGAAIGGAFALARHVDALGFTRFWVAEHHALGAVESSAPEVVIGQLAAATAHLRVGSGGVLLPNHRPLHVAEQFRVLETLHPGRIDLGIGRSEGATDDATVLAFARPQDNAHAGGFARQLDELLAFGEVAPLPADDPLASVRATPHGVALPPVFLLGSSPDSAATAGRLGLGYGFAVHTNPERAVEALLRYRAEFVPSAQRRRPHAILAAMVMVGEDDEHAAALNAPWRLAMARHRAGSPSRLLPVEQALAHDWSEAEREAHAGLHPEADVVGGPERVRERIERLAAAARADELIAITNTSDPAERRASFTRLAEVFELRRPRLV
ncbi:LLM class flavin-dependent oxidoreductase [Conexibacter sp. CPCC 206217]|uniref:LLM class flavin-dependent oxidoreductase n=1 Tax=Conexibacter sp. CPCC 206217 TaxID=3064574 RepID=UPI00271F5D83|nr:LLM class flavin-dependent oxidoreductase [Conexibacter sp. CPCC 206217]MDO8208830.1 LLM class flavin-dependent oxidoreductase [Conexibacter sp. CPCC 206217]